MDRQAPDFTRVASGKKRSWKQPAYHAQYLHYLMYGYHPMPSYAWEALRSARRPGPTEERLAPGRTAGCCI